MMDYSKPRWFAGQPITMMEYDKAIAYGTIVSDPTYDKNGEAWYLICWGSEKPKLVNVTSGKKIWFK